MIRRALHHLRQLRHDRQGVTAIEFALIAPLLLVLIMGIIEFSLIMYTSSILESSVSSAARYGITGDSYGSDSRIVKIKQTISDYSKGFLKPENIKIEFKAYDDITTSNNANLTESKDNNCGQFGRGNQAVFYKVSYPWVNVTPLASLVRLLAAGSTMTNQWNLSSVALVANENFGTGTCE